MSDLLRTARKSARDATRSTNLRFVLQTVMSEQPISRAEIARITKLTRATVSELVGVLLDARFVYEAGEGRSGGGKRPTLLRVDAAAHNIVAVDLSARPARAAVVDLEGEVLSTLTATGVAPVTPDEVCDLIDETLRTAKAEVLGIGIAVPGLVNDGVVIQAVNLGWGRVSLARLVGARTRLPVHVANDAHVAAIHEFGDYASRSNAVVVLVGDGVGAGMVLNGRPYLGDGHGAGEIGHIMVAGTDGSCHCGLRGCLETVATLPALLAAAGIDDAGTEDEQVDRLVQSGRDDLFEFAGRALGTVLATLVAVLDVHRPVVRGAIVRLGDPFVSSMRQALADNVLPAVRDRVQLEVDEQSSVIHGAWALVLAEHLGVTRR